MIRTLTAAALFAALTTGAQAGKIDDIQRKGHFYYRIAQNASPANVQSAFKVLPKNSPASCSHEAAIKLLMIREQMPHLNPEIMIYDTLNAQGVYWPHAVVVIEKQGGGFMVLNNRDRWVDHVANLNGYRNHKRMTYEQALRIYGSR